jgi:alkanesulfonate monooxygenase SsuD/methylene tetrahydromethanopterin reductase-like flavin-dependent oxidoreductase (luciferase family)
VVALAVLSEQAGLDLVTFQDHPYVAKFLDTWTLLSFVAARTSRVRLAPNVANLPLRPPAMLARAVASLDRLTGGRVELGLGSGAFWEGIASMGGPDLKPGDRVTALEEGIEVLREMWDTSATGGVKVDGRFHRVVGAKRAAPAHPVQLWIGAYRPRMLRLTGRLADGWLPSSAYLKPGDLQIGNAAIDESAEQAGRSSAEIRRLLNISGRFSDTSRGDLDGPVEQWVDELAELALGDGISAFIFGSDDPRDLQRFAAEVAPAVREVVAAERERPGAEQFSPVEQSVIATAAAARPAASAGFAVVPTPDDGTRRSDVRPWDESTRPSGPARETGMTYSSGQQAQAQHLIDVHDALRTELSRVHGLIDQVAAGTLDVGAARSELNQLTMRQNNWTLGTYCESYCRVVATHHTLEDQAMLPHLRAADPRLAPVVDRLVEEHHIIHGLLEGVDAALVRLVSEPDGLPGLRAAVDVLADALLSHLSYEERELVEPLARHGLWPGGG